MNQVGNGASQASDNSSEKQSSEQALGQALQDARKKAGFTQQELCQRSGLSYSTLAKIERGAIKAPSIFTIQAIAAALGTDLNGLMGFAPAPMAGKKTSRSGVKFVYFDINGCLVQFFHGAFTKLAQDTSATPDVVETTFWHYNDAVCRGEMTIEEFNSILSKQLKSANIDWKKYYMDAVEPISVMQELVTWAADNYHVGLLSNIMPGFIDTMMENGMLPNIKYSAIIDSSVVGAIKPEITIYEKAMEKAGVEPGEILFVDDSRTNLMAAERMGWRVLWFDDFRPEESARRVRDSLEPGE
jgi:FMN phosphatase YigB (HAD superfamily)/DNA-binding Xre family transcriptional regulator